MKFIVLVVTLFCYMVHAQTPPAGTTHVQPYVMLSAATTTSTGLAIQPYPLDKTFQACGTTSAGTGAATTKVEVSDIATPATADWITLGTITLTLGTTQTCDGFASASRWKWYRINLSALSGTTGTVTATMGY